MKMAMAASENKGEEMPKDDLKEMCPFVDDPHEDCYCVNMDSRKIGYAVYYCGENFTECNIYKRIMNDESNSHHRR